MITDQRDRTGSHWLALLALPVLCCLGHAVLLGLGIGSLAAVTGAITSSVVLAVVGLVLAAALTLVLRRRAQR